jgi:hypothetical protein
VSDHGLAARLHVDIFDGDLLLAFAAVLVQGVNLARINRHQLRRMLQTLFNARKCLARNHRAAQALQGGTVCRDHLSGEHSFDLVRGLNTLQQRNR